LAQGVGAQDKVYCCIHYSIFVLFTFDVTVTMISFLEDGLVLSKDIRNVAYKRLWRKHTKCSI